MSDGDLTVYALAQKTGISQPQVKYRLEKLLASTIVDRVKVGNRTVYSIHPVFHKHETVDSLMTELVKLFEVIDEIHPTPLMGLKTIISFLIEILVEIKDDNNNSSQLAINSLTGQDSAGAKTGS